MMLKSINIAGILTIVLVGLYILSISLPLRNGPHTTFPANVQVAYAEYAADFSDDKVLTGASHNIFVGKVIRQIEARERGFGPETQFEVEVVENIKGNLYHSVVVNQSGGYRKGILYVVGEGDVVGPAEAEAYLLRPGSTYLFATRYNEQEDWHTLNSFPTARRLISADPNLSVDELKALANSDSRANELRTAYPNEVLLEADITSGKTYNDYQTRKPLPQVEASKTDEMGEVGNE